MKCHEALRSLHLRAADACSHRGPVTGEARTISSHDFGSVPKALKPPVGVSIAALPLKIKIGVQGHQLPLAAKALNASWNTGFTAEAAFRSLIEDQA